MQIDVYIKFVSNYKLLTKITILSELSLFNKICIIMVIWWKKIQLVIYYI